MSSATLTPIGPAPDTAPDVGGDLQVTVARDELLEALSWVSQAIPRRPPVQVLLGARLVADSGGLTVTGYDYELCASQTVAPPAGRGAALVPAAALTALLRTLPRGVDVRLEASTFDGEPTVTITAGSPGGLVTFDLPRLAYADYPQTPAAGAAAGGVVDGADLAHLARVAVAAGKEDTLPVLTGVLLEQSPTGGTSAAATDRYRLAVAGVARLAWPFGPCLVPARTLRRAGSAFVRERRVRLWCKTDGSDGGFLTISGGSRTLTTRLLDGEFPNYRSLLPDDTPTVLTVDRDALDTAVRQAAVIAARHSPVRLDVQDQLTVRAGDLSPARSNVQVPDASRTGPPLEVAFNPGYLRPGLQSLPAGPVSLAFTAPNRPMVLRSLDQDAADFLYLLMPVRMHG